MSTRLAPGIAAPAGETSCETNGARTMAKPETDERDEMLRSLWQATPPELVAQLPRGGVQLDYLGHADTCRLIANVDPLWKWEPDPEFAALWGESGAVVRDKDGYPLRLFIKLTILNVSRPGIGSVTGGKSDPEKELIGDAIRNAAMRFGVGADLWSKAKGGLDDNEGTYRRGQRNEPADPEVPFTSIGWKDRAEQDAWRQHYTEEARKLTEDQRKEFKADAESLGLVWKEPIPKSVADDVDKLIAEYQQDATSPGGVAERVETGEVCPGGCGYQSHDCRCPSRPF